MKNTSWQCDVKRKYEWLEPLFEDNTDVLCISNLSRDNIIYFYMYFLIIVAHNF